MNPPEPAERASEAVERQFSTADAARYVGMTYHSIIYNVGKGKLTPSGRTAGGQPWFTQEELDRFMRMRKLKIAS